MLRPVERSITVSAPQRIAHTIFSTSSAARGGDGGVADVGVDLHQEVAADDDRLEFRVVDVGGNDGAAGGDLGADEFRRDEVGDCGAEILAVGAALLGALRHACARPRFSRCATKIISSVMMPARANSSWVTRLAGPAREHAVRGAGHPAPACSAPTLPLSSGFTSRGREAENAARSIQGARSGAQPASRSMLRRRDRCRGRRCRRCAAAARSAVGCRSISRNGTAMSGRPGGLE